MICLTQAGAPSQLELFDHKPQLKEQFDKDLPESVRQGQRLTGMTAKQAAFPLAPTRFKFGQHGQSCAWISELLPYTAKMAEILGQQIIVDNRPGAGGVIGADAGAKAAPDGYTVTLVSTGHATNPGLHSKLPYDTLGDFVPVTLGMTLPIETHLLQAMVTEPTVSPATNP